LGQMRFRYETKRNKVTQLDNVLSALVTMTENLSTQKEDAQT